MVLPRDMPQVKSVSKIMEGDEYAANLDSQQQHTTPRYEPYRTRKKTVGKSRSPKWLEAQVDS